MKEHYFIYALIGFIVISALMLTGAVIYIGVTTVENEVLKEENQELEARLDEIDDEIRNLTEQIERFSRDVDDSTGWNKEASDGLYPER